ncbi:NAD-dependent epimerase/dehydratase family protein [Tessaracoccus antarcticus]|nr:NAD(P)-dependent oxidoreductase [Tessaracoccus antarcticus]
MRVVVTGGSGRVGQVTVRGLAAAGHHVVIADRVPPSPDGEWGEGFVGVSADNHADLLDACGGADAIVHLAGFPKPEGYPPHLVHNNNVTASYNVLCVAIELGMRRVVMASSVNAMGLTWSRAPAFDYFPVDEDHATRNEDPYSLSKWVGEQQADSVVRLHPDLSVASLRLHMFMRDRAEAQRNSSGDLSEGAARGLWGYTTHRMWIDACRLALTADLSGHEVFFVVADRTVLDEDSEAFARSRHPGTQIRGQLSGNQGFFDCGKAKRILGWSGRDD